LFADDGSSGRGAFAVVALLLAAARAAGVVGDWTTCTWSGGRSVEDPHLGSIRETA